MSDRMALQIFAEHCAAAAEAMAYTLMRTAHSTFVKETEDFSCGLQTPEGLTFASPRKLGSTWFMGLDYSGVFRAVDRYEDGDIWITNDPYSGAVATHTPDLHIWKPIFFDGQLICFAAGHIHNTDMGGAVPASLSRTLTEIHQEGVRVPPTRISRAGRIDETVLAILAVNVRVPHQNVGDFHAQLASMAVAERRVKEIVARVGVEEFSRNMYALLDYAEQQSRRVINSIPDGEFEHVEFADEDSDGGHPCRIALTIRKAGEELVMDFTGSDPQLSSSMNVPTGGHERHALITVGLVQALYTMDRSILLNSGTLRPVRAVLPHGTVVNPQAPAAVGMRTLVCNIIHIATLGALSKAMPDRLAASPAGAQALVNVRTMDRHRGTILASLGPVGGGAGGSASSDGIDGHGAMNASLKNTPIEITEIEVPIKFLKYGLKPDTGGAGLRRGGMATEMQFQVFAPQSSVTARNKDRARFGTWGLCGGQAGATATFFRARPDGEEQDLGNSDFVKLDPGDVIRITGPGAGGWGDPLDRDPEAVRIDVRRGLVSAARARSDYGVCTDGHSVNRRETANLRAAMRRDRPLFDFGEARDDFQRVWNDERYGRLTSLLAKTEIPWRHWVKRQIFDRINSEAAPEASGNDVEEIFQQIAAQFPSLLVAPNPVDERHDP